MSKRGAESQGSREGWFEGDGTSPGAPMSSTPQKATAAQLASRKILHGRAGRRMAPARPATFQTSQPSQSPPQSPFNSVDPNTVNGNATVPSQSTGFNYGQLNGGLSQTFPPNNTSNMQQNSQSASFGGFGSGSSSGFNPQVSAPTSNFSFTLGGGAPQNNPFSTASNSTSNTPTSGSYQGSIFSIPPSNSVAPNPRADSSVTSMNPFGKRPSDGAAFSTSSQPSNASEQKPKFREHDDTEDHPGFAPHAPFLSQNNEGPSSQPASDVFRQASSPQQQAPSTGNVFGQSNSQPLSNIFGQPTSQQQQKQPTSNIFGQSSSQQSQTPSDIFGQSANQPQQAQPGSNIFGHFNSQFNQPKSDLFGQNATLQPQTPKDNNAPAPYGDSMQTSPDNSPQKNDQPKQGAFSFLNSQPQNPSSHSATTPVQGGSLFDRVTQPTHTPAAAAAIEKGGISSTNPPSNTSQPDSIEGTTEKPGSNAESSTTSTNIFGKHAPDGPAFSSSSEAPSTASTKEAEKPAIGNRPFATPNLAKASSTDVKSAGSNPFASLKVPSLSQPSPSFAKPTPTATVSSETSETPSDTSFKIKDTDATSKLPSSNQNPPSTIPSSSSPTIPNVGTPRTVPAHFTEAQKHQMVTGYRLRSLDMGLKKYMLDSGFFTEPLLIMRFYEEKKQEILAAQGLPKEGLVGSKRKSADDEIDLEVNGPAKKSRSETSFFGSPTKATTQMPLVPGPATNGATTNPPVFSQPAPGNQVGRIGKRPADEDLVKDNVNVINGTGKKLRGDDQVSYPSLPATSQPNRGSETSNIFKSILSKPNDGSSESTSAPLVNGISDAGSSTPKSSAESSNSSTSSTINNFYSKQPPLYPASSSTFQYKAATAFGSAGIAPSGLSQSNSMKLPSENNKTSTMSSSPFQLKPGFTQTPTGSSTNSFTTKPVTTAAPSSDTVKPPSLKPPTFFTGEPVNFLAQFGKAAEETAEKEKAKRKAEEFDSDEDDEAEWERKDAEAQRAKKQKLVEAAKGKVTKFVTGSGFALAEKNESTEPPKPTPPAPPSFQFDVPKPTPGTTGGLFGSGTPAPSTSPGTSVFSTLGAQKAMNKNNIFGHLSDAESGAERSQTGDADDEDTDSEAESEGVINEDPNDKGVHDEQESTQSLDSGPNDSVEGPKNTGGNNIYNCGPSPHGALAKGYACLEQLAKSHPPTGTLFDRVPKDENANPVRALSPAKDKTKNPFKLSSAIVPGDFVAQLSPSRVSTSNLLNQSSPSRASSAFGQSSSNTSVTSPFGSSGSPVGDHTWKQDSPIRFGGTGNAPGLNVTAATPTKPISAEQKGSPSNGFSGLFGAAKATAQDAVSKPATNFFGAGTPATKSTDVGFGFAFGGPPKSATNILAPPSGLTSNATSRATSPGATTGGESANDSTAEGADGEIEHHEQLNLAAGGPGEEDEDILFEVRAKALMYDSEQKEWPIQGLGPLRVLKDRKTGTTRILLRQDPSGRVVLNAALMNAMSYDYTKPKGVKMGVATDDGKLGTWMIKVGKDDDAIRLSSVLEDNKSN